MLLNFSKIEPIFIKELGPNHQTDHYYAILKIKGNAPSPTKGTFIILDKTDDFYFVKYSYAAAAELNLHEECNKCLIF